MSRTNSYIRSMLAGMICFLIWTAQPTFGQVTFETAYPSPALLSAVDQTFDLGNIAIGPTGSIPTLLKTDIGGFAQWRIDAGFNGYEDPLDVQETANTDIIWTSGVSSPLPSGRSFISRSNNAGILQWNQTFQVIQTPPFPNPPVQWSAHPTSIIEQQIGYVGDIVIGGIIANSTGNRHVYVHKVNSAGTTVWVKGLYHGDVQKFTCIREAIDGNIIVVCENEFQQMMVWKIDGGSGAPIWGKSHPGGIEASDAIVDPNTGDIVVTGSMGNDKVFAIALSNGGGTLWSRSYISSVQNISSYDIAVPLTGGSNTYMITGEADLPGVAGTGAFFLQIATNGTPLASNISYSAMGSTGKALGMTPSISTNPAVGSGYVAVGQINGGASYLLRVTEDGRNNCTAALPIANGPSPGPLGAVAFSHDPYLVVVPAGPLPEVLLSASEQIICPHLFIKQGTQQPTRNASDTPMALSIAPNPVVQGQSLHLQIDNPEQQSLTILVTNTLGQTVFRSRLQSTAAESTIQIPTGSWSMGMYSVAVLHGDQTIQTASFVVSR